MNTLRLFLWSVFVVLAIGLFVEGHEGHHHPTSLFSSDNDLLLSQNGFADSFTGWMATIGRFHLIFLHFPIALIVMTVVAECLSIWFDNPLFPQAARFMIVAAAIFAPITALLGLAYGYGQHYEGFSLDLFVWHRYFGLLTAALAIFAAILRERYIRRHSTSLVTYYITLFFFSYQ